MRSVASGNSTGSWVSVLSGTDRQRRFVYARIHTLIRSLQSFTWSITDWPIPPCHQATSSRTKKLRHLSRYMPINSGLDLSTLLQLLPGLMWPLLSLDWPPFCAIPHQPTLRPLIRPSPTCTEPGHLLSNTPLL